MEKIETTVEERLIKIENLLLTQKKALTFSQACLYTDISPSYMYKLTSRGEIPHYKPNGKQIYFDIDELNAWLLSNRIKPKIEIEADANTYISLSKKGGRK